VRRAPGSRSAAGRRARRQRGRHWAGGADLGAEGAAAVVGWCGGQWWDLGFGVVGERAARYWEGMTTLDLGRKNI